MVYLHNDIKMLFFYYHNIVFLILQYLLTEILIWFLFDKDSTAAFCGWLEWWLDLAGSTTVSLKVENIEIEHNLKGQPLLAMLWQFFIPLLKF